MTVFTLLEIMVSAEIAKSIHDLYDFHHHLDLTVAKSTGKKRKERESGKISKP